MDVAGINRSLKEEPKSCRALQSASRRRTPHCPNAAIRSPSPTWLPHASTDLQRLHPRRIQRFERIWQGRTRNLEYAKKGDPEMAEFAETSFAEETCRVIEILAGAGRIGSGEGGASRRSRSPR